MECRYRKTKEGEWVVMGPVGTVRAGSRVAVTTKNGEVKQEWISNIGKPFETDKGRMVYGYIARSNDRGESPTEKQIQTLQKLIKRVSQIEQFDSFTGTGEDIAQEASEALKGGLSRKEASQWIKYLITSIDDEM